MYLDNLRVYDILVKKVYMTSRSSYSINQIHSFGVRRGVQVYITQRNQAII